MTWKLGNQSKYLLGFCGLLLCACAFAQSNAGVATIEFTHSRYNLPVNARIATITLRRAGNTNAAVTADLISSSENPAAGADEFEQRFAVSFPAGKNDENVDIPIPTNLSRKTHQMLRLVLSNPGSGAVLGSRSTADLFLPKIWNTGWLNFGLDHVAALRRTWFEIPIWQYLASLIYIFLAFYISKLFDVLIRGKLRQWAQRTTTPIDDLLLELLRGPIKVVLFVILLHIGLRVFLWPEWVASFISKALRIIVAVSLTYMALKFVDLLTRYWKQRISGHEDRPFSEQLLPIIRNTLKVFVVVVSVLLTLQNLGLNITSLIASLSIGGLAISLAAQDTLANLFGAVAVLSDKPFLIGDRIKLDQVDGIVESVGLRSTRVRTADGNIVSIPNKTMGNAIITRFSQHPSAPAQPKPNSNIPPT